MRSFHSQINNLNQSSLTAIVNSISTLIIWKAILVLAVPIELLEYSTFHHPRQKAEVADWSEVS